MSEKTYNLIQTNDFKNDIINFSEYCINYSPEFWYKMANKIKKYLSEKLLAHPNRYPYFIHSNFPYRAIIFPVGKRTKYWIIYRVNDENYEITLLRFWNASQNPLEFKVN